MYRDVQEDQQLVDLQTCSETSCCIIFLWRIQNKPTSTEDYGNPQARETLACQTEEGKVHIHFKYLTEQHHCEMDLSKKTSITKFYVIRNFRHNEGTTFFDFTFILFLLNARALSRSYLWKLTMWLSIRVPMKVQPSMLQCFLGYTLLFFFLCIFF